MRKLLTLAALTLALSTLSTLSTLPVLAASDPLHLLPKAKATSAATAKPGAAKSAIASAPGPAKPAPAQKQLTQSAVAANPILLIQQFTIQDAQNAWNDAMRIDATCTSGTATGSTALTLSGCSATPHLGSVLTSVGGTGGLLAPVTISAVGAFAAGAGSVTMNTAQTLAGASVTATFSSPAPDTTAAMCYAELIVLLNTPINNPFPTSPGLLLALQKARDVQAMVANLQSPTGALVQFNQACAPLVLSVQNTLIALGIATGAVVGTSGLALPALPGLGGLLALPAL
jgi:hypothetical protein